MHVAPVAVEVSVAHPGTLAEAVDDLDHDLTSILLASLPNEMT
jgi:hypothetical protein